MTNKKTRDEIEVTRWKPVLIFDELVHKKNNQPSQPLIN